MKKPHPFRFGCINEQMKPAKEWRDHVRQIESLGYDIMLMRDHFVPDVFGDTFGPIVALTTAANVTSKLRVGSMVMCNDFRHPAVLAKEAATLDLLSDGRFELGLGAGWMRAEYEHMGLVLETPGKRIERLEESIAAMRGLFSDGAFSFSGRHYSLNNLNGFPKPGSLHIPLLIGGGNQRILKLAGREANIVGILITNVSSGVVVNDPIGRMSAAVTERINWVKEGAGQRFDDIELSSAIDVVITDRRRESTEEFIGQRNWQDICVEQVWDMPTVFIGTLDHIVDQFQQRREQFGFSYYWIADDRMEDFAPIVARLAGK